MISLDVAIASMVDALTDFLHSPIKDLGFVLAATMLAMGLLLRWVRRAVSA